MPIVTSVAFITTHASSRLEAEFVDGLIRDRGGYYQPAGFDLSGTFRPSGLSAPVYHLPPGRLAISHFASGTTTSLPIKPFAMNSV
jgi:hypothetical protein